jgi:hypothetical protein
MNDLESYRGYRNAWSQTDGNLFGRAEGLAIAHEMTVRMAGRTNAPRAKAILQQLLGEIEKEGGEDLKMELQLRREEAAEKEED